MRYEMPIKKDPKLIREIKRIVSKNVSYNRMYYGRELQQVGIL